jgi:hypothetical protein
VPDVFGRRFQFQEKEKMTKRLSTSLIALSTVLAAPAMADVTAADVWANQQTYYGAMGIALNGTLSGDQVTNPEINVILPMGVASFQIVTDDVTMADNGDGTVSITYPSPMAISIAGGLKDEGSFTADMIMTHDGYAITASGDPDDITYEIDAQNMRLEFNEVSMGGADAPKLSIEGFVNLASWVGTAQVTEGNLITRSSNFETGVTDVDFMFAIDDVQSRSTQTTQPLATVGSVSLPVGGSNIMNLSEAVRNGLSFVFETQGGASTSTAETTMNGDVINSQSTTAGPQTASFSFDEDGLKAIGEGSDFQMVMNDPLIFPGDLEFGIEQLTMNYDVPLNASEETQDFRIATSLQGVTLGDTIWNLFDPAGQLPRDPAEVSFDVTGNGTNGTDLLDFIAMSQSFAPPMIEIDDVTIENLRISAAGAEATATGAMTFDWTDFQTIPGIARPEGQVTVNLNGANGLMDKLAAMGIIPEEELMMPRMMLGMFATPVGDDMLETVLEVNSEGHVLANGQRLQ